MTPDKCTPQVSEPTVRKRIDRLFRDEVIKVAAVLNPGKTGYATDVVIGIRVAPGKLLEVGEELAAFDEVVYLGYVTGQYDIIVEMLFRDDEALFAFLHRVPGPISWTAGRLVAHRSVAVSEGGCGPADHRNEAIAPKAKR